MTHETVNTHPSPGEVLADITLVANKDMMTPSQAHDLFMAPLESCWPPQIYFSTTITSGGFSRDQSVTRNEATLRNCQAAAEIALAIVEENSMSPHDYILPSDLGYIKHWTQADYLIFWMMTLQGIPNILSDKKRNIEALTLQLTESSILVMESKEASYDQKLQAYKDLVIAYVTASGDDEVMRYSVNIPRVVFLIDTKLSLGCMAERYFAPVVGAKMFDLSLGSSEIGPLKTTIGKLAAVGARVFNEPSRFVLSPTT